MDTPQKTTFYFGGGIPEVLIGGLSLFTTRDFVLFSMGLIIVTVLVESLQRMSRACHRRLLRGAQTASSVGHEVVLQPRSLGRGSPRDSHKQASRDGEKSPFLEARQTQSGSILDEGEHRGCMTGGEGIEGEEMTSLVGITPNVVSDASVEEGGDVTRREKVLRSLSLSLMTDRWEMLQVMGQRKATRSRRFAVHVLQTVFRMLQMAFGFSLMLVIMTYNACFLICVVGGAGLGYLIFSSDLHTLYASYAEAYVARQIAEERMKQARYTLNDPWPKKSWKTRLMKNREMETTI